ncbi:hypothetical protein KFK09_017555 [Dendrobium nobile]|uniref:Transposase MuDR plant domain-containing protein n=1 Tax=Dendrobium nobile TaxID=94219 RepID=A0A8T3B2I8_DENNO|nr:hypothetical protein KFK09_017555 [Dendrobium nobile]
MVTILKKIYTKSRKSIFLLYLSMVESGFKQMTNIGRGTMVANKGLLIEKGQLTIFTLRGEIARICPWIKGHPYNMYYYIFGTSPKEYKEINSDVEVTEFINVYNDNFRAEIVITIQGVEGHESNSTLKEVVSSEQVVECSFNHNDVSLSAPTSCSKDIAVGTYFPDAISFKHALRSVAIKENFGVRIKASDKTRVIATCAYQGCKWRIRASLCEEISLLKLGDLKEIILVLVSIVLVIS